MCVCLRVCVCACMYVYVCVCVCVCWGGGGRVYACVYVRGVYVCTLMHVKSKWIVKSVR